MSITAQDLIDLSEVRENSGGWILDHDTRGGKKVVHCAHYSYRLLKDGEIRVTRKRFGRIKESYPEGIRNFADLELFISLWAPYPTE